MFRKTWAILNDDEPLAGGVRANADVDADLIITAVVAGFCLSSLEKGYPVEFGAEASEADDIRDLAEVVDLLDKLMPSGHAKKIKATSTPVLSTMLITGSPDAVRTAFADRHIQINDETAQQLHDLAMSVTDPIGYQGKGAYTGLVSDPVGKVANLTSTARRNVPADYGDRWVMRGYPKDGLAWGLLMGKLSVNDGMSEEPLNGARLVGYVHGMIQAIYRSVASGPQCTPWEIAVGTLTTKLASCMGCALFMYANNYPPSCIHLGRAESWAPFYPLNPGDPGYNVIDEVIVETNDRWSRHCRAHLLSGVGLLEQAERERQVLDGRHRARLPLLRDYLDEHSDPRDGGNLVLDALTVHEKVTTFIKRTLV